MLITLPVIFISNIFFPLDTAPAWLNDLANVVPVQRAGRRHAGRLRPADDGSGFVGDDLLVLGIWTLVGARIMQRYLQQLTRRA